MVKGVLISYIVEKALESFSQGLKRGLSTPAFNEELVEIDIGDVVEVDSREYDAFSDYLEANGCYLDIQETYGAADEDGDYYEQIIGSIQTLDSIKPRINK